jgi:hypothetical protein
VKHCGHTISQIVFHRKVPRETSAERSLIEGISLKGLTPGSQMNRMVVVLLIRPDF